MVLHSWYVRVHTMSFCMGMAVAPIHDHCTNHATSCSYRGAHFIWEGGSILLEYSITTLATFAWGVSHWFNDSTLNLWNIYALILHVWMAIMDLMFFKWNKITIMSPMFWPCDHTLCIVLFSFYFRVFFFFFFDI